LRCLASALQSEDRYDAGALRLLQREIFAKIFADLSFSSDLIQYPEIADVPAGRPLLVAGFGPHRKHAAAQSAGAGCQCAGAVAVGIVDTVATAASRDLHHDPRIEIAQHRLDAFTEADLAILQIHPMGARAPDECHWMMRHTPLTAMFYQAPEYWSG